MHQASFSFSFPLIDQLTSPGGFWVSAGDPDFCKRIPELRSAASCGPSDKTGAVPAVTAPTVPGPGDCNHLRVIKPSRFESVNDRAGDARWAAVSSLPSFQLSKNRVAVLCWNHLHFIAQGGEKAQYIFGLDKLSMKWASVVAVRHHSSVLAA